MDIFWFFSVIAFLWVSAITPGPNNILLTTTAANFGFLSSLSILFGILFGMQLLLLVIAFGIDILLTRYPELYTVLKIAGSIYLLWIAWKITTDKLGIEDNQTTTDSTNISIIQAFLLQFLNPKAWLMIVGSITSFSLIQQYSLSILMISLILLSVNIIAGLIWIAMGAIIRHLLQGQLAWRLFNGLMGLLTASSVALIWW